MEIKNGYKQTEVGVIPDDWDSLPLGDLFKFKNGLNKSKESFGYGTPIVNYNDVYLKTEIRSKDIHGKVSLSPKEIKLFEVLKGDVFFTRTSETPEEVGISSVVVEDVKDTVFSGFVLRARPLDKRLDLHYKKYCFSTKSVRSEIVSNCTYTTRALTNGKVLSRIQIPIPPLPEQQAIATALSDIDGLISSLQKLIDKKKNIKQGAMQELLTGTRKLEGFSGEWVEVELGAITKINTGKRNNEDKVKSGRYPFFVRSKHIERIDTYSFDGEAIIVPGEGNIGEIFHYIIGKFDFHQRVYKISDFSNGIHAKYVYYYMINYFGEYALRNTVKATVDSLRLPTFQKFILRLPPTIEEQTTIANILSDMDSEIEALEQKLNKYKNIKEGMMQELLTGRIRLLEEVMQ